MPFQDRPATMMAFFIHAPNTIKAQSGENTEEEAERIKKLKDRRSIMKCCFLDMAHAHTMNSKQPYLSAYSLNKIKTDKNPTVDGGDRHTSCFYEGATGSW